MTLLPQLASLVVLAHVAHDTARVFMADLILGSLSWQPDALSSSSSAASGRLHFR